VEIYRRGDEIVLREKASAMECIAARNLGADRLLLAGTKIDSQQSGGRSAAAA